MSSRGHFIETGLVSLSSAALPSGAWDVTSLGRMKSPIPDTPGLAPNYWCTWAAQNYIYGDRSSHLQEQLLEGPNGGALAREAMNRALIFGESGWASFLARVHSDRIGRSAATSGDVSSPGLVLQLE